MVKEYLNEYKNEILKCLDDLKSKETWYKQIPNLLTFSRAIGMLPVNILFFSGNVVLAIILTCLLLLTDFFDGKLARKFDVQSKFGADLDAVCDKVMFLGLAIPLLINNPILITNFILEGIISYINVYGRINGLDTKTVTAGKIKTWFLSESLVAGYLVQFFGLSPLLLSILSSMTIGSQVITIDCYMKEYKEMKKMKMIDQMNVKKEEVVEELNSLENLSNERNLSVKQTNKIGCPKVKCRKKEHC